MTIKEKVKELWKLCFDDTEEFVEMYFRMRYKNERNIVIESGDEVISALQMLPYPMTFCGEVVQTSYISGACTHPDYRGNGAMRELLSQSFTRMFRNGVHLSTLIPAEPWLFDYYTRMGYASVFRYSTKDIIVPDFIPSKEIVVEAIGECRRDVHQYLSLKMAERPCCIQHTYEDFEVIMADIILSDGILFVARKENNICGVAIIYREGQQLVINELFVDTKDVEYSMLHYIRQFTGCNRITQILPPTKDDQPKNILGMARIINAKEVLQMYAAAYPEDEMQIALQDKQLSANNGYYYLCKGKCMYSAERLPGTHIQMNISELTDRILQSLDPYMSLMLN